MPAKELRYRSKKPGVCTEMFRSLLMLVNLLLAMGALALIGITGYTEAVSSNHVTNICHSCHSIVIFAIGLFCTLFIFSIIGFCALKNRNICLLLVYGLYLVLFFLGALAITIVFLLVREGKFDDRMQQAWYAGVTADPENICNIELDMQCVGWSVLCNANETYNVTNTDGCAVCTQQSQLSNFTQTCYTAFNTSIDKWYKPIVITGFALVGLALLSIVVTCKVRKGDEEEEEGTYVRM